MDPTIGKILSDINAATHSTGTLTANGNPNQQSYNFNIPVQSLRLYERYGLLTPARSGGGTRRYSADDLARLQRISALVKKAVG